MAATYTTAALVKKIRFALSFFDRLKFVKWPSSSLGECDTGGDKIWQ